MQWEGQDLQTQLFSPNGPAQEVPVRNHLRPKFHINNFKIFISLSPPCFLFSVGLLFLRFCFLHFFLQDLLTSALLSDDGHKAYHLSRRGMDSPLQVCFSWRSCVCTSISHRKKNWMCAIALLQNSSSSPFFSLANSSSIPGSRRNVGKRRSTFLPRSRATSISTLTPRGHWSCRQRQSLRWTQRRGLHICCGTTVGDSSMPSVFLHSPLLDLNQPKT